MNKIQKDFKNSAGKWVQRSHVDDKYTWTTSGVLWNNIKERCTIGGTTQAREPTYIGCENLFTDFQTFAEWNINQVGYGLGYQLDADILQEGNKQYSAEKCVLIPASLNKFLQSYRGKRGKYPQGMYIRKCDNKLHVSIEYGDTKYSLGLFSLSDIESARAVYKKEKDTRAAIWYKRLLSGEFEVDKRVIEYMKTWEHICDWEPEQDD